jgi:hypothetical protein
LPAATQQGACRLGSARFDEFAAERRTQRGTSLRQETMDRLGTARPSASRGDPGEGGLPTASTAREPDFSAPGQLDEEPEYGAAVREDGSSGNFQIQRRSPLH